MDSDAPNCREEITASDVARHEFDPMRAPLTRGDWIAATLALAAAWDYLAELHEAREGSAQISRLMFNTSAAYRRQADTMRDAWNAAPTPNTSET